MFKDLNSVRRKSDDAFFADRQTDEPQDQRFEHQTARVQNDERRRALKFDIGDLCF